MPAFFPRTDLLGRLRAALRGFFEAELADLRDAAFRLVARDFAALRLAGAFLALLLALALALALVFGLALAGVFLFAFFLLLGLGFAFV